jgi:hypothetical protein
MKTRLHSQQPYLKPMKSILSRFLKISIILILVLVFECAYSQIVKHEIIYSHQDIKSTIGGSITKWLDFTHPLSETGRIIKSVKIYRELSSGEDYELGENIFNVDLSSLVRLNNELLTVSSFPLIEFAINEGKPQVTHFINVSDISKIDNVNRLMVKVLNGNIIPLSAGDINEYLKLNLSFKVTCEIEYGWDVSVFPIDDIEKVEVNPNKKQQRFRWNTINSDYCFNYQLQLLRLYNKSDEYLSSPDHILADIDWTKALTIETQSSGTSFDLTIAEGSGYYIWRVRPIGNYYEGDITNEKNFGEWSNSTANSEIVIQPGFDNIDCFYYVDKEEDINWIYSRTFTEGNSHISENITYATPLQNIRQSQQYISTIGHKVVTQIVPDYTGRPAVSSLPVPLEGEINGYQENFMQNSSSKLFSAADFDTELNYDEPGEVDMTTGEFIYYNGNNGYVPSSEGFPYQRTLYLNDGSSRVVEQSGVGLTHSKGNAVDRGKTVKTMYGQPSQTELDRVFGDEAPDASKVSKVITVDQNEITSISYTTFSGKTLATCLLYNSNNALLPLDSYTPGSFPVNHLVKGNSRLGDALISTSQLVIEETTPITITYKLPIPSMDFPCGNVYLDCNYTLYISIYNSTTQTLIEEWETTVSQSTSTFEYTPPGLPINLDPGEYTIEKILVPGGKEDFLIEIDDAMSIDLIVDYVEKKLLEVTDPLLKEEFYRAMIEFSFAFNDCTQNPGNCSLTDGLYDIEGSMIDLQLTNSHWFFLQINQLGTFENVTDYSQIENLAQGELTYILIRSSCCQDIRVPIIFESMFGCPEQDEIANYEPKFQEYLLELVSPSEYANLMGGYLNNDFNDMIKKMLNYKVWNSSTSEYDYHYNCNNLWACWINTIKANTGISSPDYGGIKISDEVDGHDEGYTQENNQHNDLFDNKSNFKMPGGWALKIIINLFKLSDKVRDKSSNGDEGYSYEVNLPEYFLDCAGYKFDMVLEDGDICPDTDYDDSRHFYNGNVSPANIDPNIKDRVYAFKYFYYDYDNVSNGKNNACEMIHCYEYDNPIPPTPQYCHNIEPCLSSKDDWLLFEDYKGFLDCLRGMSDVSVELDPGQEMRSCLQLKFKYGATYQNLIIELEDKCNSNCEGNKEHYANIIKNYFELRCYTVDGCVTDESSVSMDVINHLADKMVDKCKSFCDIQGEVECTELTCIDLMTEQEVFGFTRLKLADPCDDLTLKVSEWLLDFDVYSKCIGPPPPDHLCSQLDPSTGTVEDFREFGTGVMKDIQHTKIKHFTVTDTEGEVTSP